MRNTLSPPSIFGGLESVLPGAALISVIAVAAFAAHSLPYIGVLSSLILAIVIGMTIRNTIGISSKYQPGVTFGLKKVLRIAVAILGLQLSISQIEQVGGRGFLVVAASLLSTFLFTTWLGGRMGINKKLAQLIAAGTSICGASAVLGVNAVTQGSDEDVAYSVGTVTLFGTAAMFIYPLLAKPLHLSPDSFGLWAGSSIHEVAQVVAAAFQDGKASGQVATISKLSRVMLLAPVVLALGVMGARKPGSSKFDIRKVTIPWFVLGFVALVLANSLNIVPSVWKANFAVADQFLLAAAMAAMGLETHFDKLRAMGLKPLVLGASAWAFIALISLTLVRWLY